MDADFQDIFKCILQVNIPRVFGGIVELLLEEGGYPFLLFSCGWPIKRSVGAQLVRVVYLGGEDGE